MRKLLERLSSLKVILLVIVLACWLLPTLVLGSFMGSRFFASLKDKTEAAVITGAEHARVLTIQNIEHVINLAKDVTYEGELSSAVSAYESGKEKYETYFRIVRNYVERKYGREYLCDFAIFFRTSDPAHVFFTTTGFNEATHFQRHVQDAVLSIAETLDTRCHFYAQDGRTYLVRNLYNIKMERYGILVLGINMQRTLSPVIAGAKRWNSTYTVRLDDYTEGPQENTGLDDGLREAGDMLIYTQRESTRDYSLMYQVQTDKHAVYAEMEAFQTLMTCLMLMLLPVMALITVFVSRRIVRPITILSNASEKIERGELGVTVPMQGKDELGRLGRAFSRMSTELKRLIDKSYKEEIALRDARIQAMQSRINPHFINNALENINWQARMEGSDTISGMVDALSVLMNASLDRGDEHLAKLSDELVTADAYFYFVRLRFGDRLTINKDIGEGAGDAPVPRLCVQTLLENAIEHGIAPAGGGEIGLIAYLKNGGVIIEVINGGSKLTAEGLERMREIMRDAAPKGEHIGLGNISQRLRLLYGDSASIRASQDARGNTVVTLCIPL